MSMRVFVIVCSVLILLGFFISCYLMTTVNPEPIYMNYKPVGRQREYIFDFENMRGKGNRGGVQYGLEKAPRSSETQVPLPYLFRKNNPNLLSSQKPNQTTVYNPNKLSLHSRLHATRTIPMMAPLPNTTLLYTCQHVSTYSQMTELPKYNTGNNTDQISLPVKGRRRSIDSLQNRFNEISGSVLLKIVDEHGKSRVEIKVNTDDTIALRNKNYSIDNSSVDNTQDFLISLEELPDETEIRILPNATLVVSDVSEEFVSKLDINTENSSPKAQKNQENAKHTSKYDNVKGQNDTIAVISRPGSIGPTTAAMTVGFGNTNREIQRTTQSVKQLLKTTSTEDLALKVLFDNVTRSFKRNIQYH